MASNDFCFPFGLFPIYFGGHLTRCAALSTLRSLLGRCSLEIDQTFLSRPWIVLGRVNLVVQVELLVQINWYLLRYSWQGVSCNFVPRTIASIGHFWRPLVITNPRYMLMHSVSRPQCFDSVFSVFWVLNIDFGISSPLVCFSLWHMLPCLQWVFFKAHDVGEELGLVLRIILCVSRWFQVLSWISRCRVGIGLIQILLTIHMLFHIHVHTIVVTHIGP